MRHRALCVALSIGLAAAAPRQAVAQQRPPADSARAGGEACFQPRPLPRCRSFAITEFGTLRATGGREGGAAPFVWEIGGIAGASHPGERWERVRLPMRITLSPRPGGGVALAIGRAW